MVGNLTGADSDADDSHTLFLVEGAANNAWFSIDGITLKTAASFHYDDRSSYTVSIRTTDFRQADHHSFRASCMRSLDGSNLRGRFAT
ncbi:MAG TPA: hypothetical protein VK041_06250 [Opitutales bacterium]|nr:hypothetical protein [Opitutales bacterium]